MPPLFARYWFLLLSIPGRIEESNAEHEEILATLEECDALILHMGVLAQDARLGAHIARDFDAAAAFWDQSVYEELGAVLVFVRRDLWRGGRLVERTEPARAAERLAQLSLRGTALDFVSRDGTERVRLHGFEVQQLAAQDLWWISYHWTPLTPVSRDWTIVDRLSDPEEREGWQNDHHLTAGRVPRAEQTDELLLGPRQKPARVCCGTSGGGAGCGWGPLGSPRLRAGV